ncbi:MAG: LytR family transcriptional regulator, partial [Sphingobacteriia bacterium]|nr:LytR family transcriptional regulator [Sphingobacteriia bacterium]
AEGSWGRRSGLMPREDPHSGPGGPDSPGPGGPGSLGPGGPPGESGRPRPEEGQSRRGSRG